MSTNLLEPADSPYTVITKRVAEICRNNDYASRMFGWTPPENGAEEYSDEDVDPFRRRIFLDDNGNCDPDTSPKLCITEVMQEDATSILGDAAAVRSDLDAHVAIIVYVHVPNGEDGTKQKILAGNLHYFIRQVLRAEAVEEDGLWSDLEFVGPSATFFQSEGYRRAGGIVCIRAHKNTTDETYGLPDTFFEPLPEDDDDEAQ